MSETRPISEHDLHAYVDGALDAAAHARVEAWLAENPCDAARVSAYRSQREALHAQFDPVLREAVPRRLVTATRRGPKGLALALRAAAAALLLAVGFAGGWFGHGEEKARQRADSLLASESLSAHRVFVVEVKHPVEVGADQEQHLVGWLSKRMGRQITAPDLRPLGYSLMGGRLLPAHGQPAAQFMYQAKSGERVTVYIRHNESRETTAFRFEQAGGLSAFYWLDGPLSYAIVADLPRDKLQPICDAVYAQLDED
jgi:anti-sigma factor RsiW